MSERKFVRNWQAGSTDSERAMGELFSMVKYLAQEVGLIGEGGVGRDGETTAGTLGSFTSIIFYRSWTSPTLPTTTDYTAAGWSDAPPAATGDQAPLWSSSARLKADGTFLDTGWSDPSRVEGVGALVAVITSSAGNVFLNGSPSSLTLTCTVYYNGTDVSASSTFAWTVAGVTSGTASTRVVNESDITGAQEASVTATYNGITAEDAITLVNTSSGGYTDFIFKRDPLPGPSTPTGNSPVGWSDAPPSGTDPLWMSTSSKDGNGGLVGTWSTPRRIDGDMTVEYSVAGSDPWDSKWSATYLYMRHSTDGGNKWSNAMRIIGEKGDPFVVDEEGHLTARPTNKAAAWYFYSWSDSKLYYWDPIYSAAPVWTKLVENITQGVAANKETARGATDPFDYFATDTPSYWRYNSYDGDWTEYTSATQGTEGAIPGAPTGGDYYYTTDNDDLWQALEGAWNSGVSFGKGDTGDTGANGNSLLTLWSPVAPNIVPFEPPSVILETGEVPWLFVRDRYSTQNHLQVISADINDLANQEVFSDPASIPIVESGVRTLMNASFAYGGDVASPEYFSSTITIKFTDHDAGGNDPYILRVGTSAAGDYVDTADYASAYLDVSDGDKIVFQVAKAAGGYFTDTSDALNLTDGDWHKIQCKVQRYASEMRIHFYHTINDGAKTLISWSTHTYEALADIPEDTLAEPGGGSASQAMIVSAWEMWGLDSSLFIHFGFELGHNSFPMHTAYWVDVPGEYGTLTNWMTTKAGDDVLLGAWGTAIPVGRGLALTAVIESDEGFVFRKTGGPGLMNITAFADAGGGDVNVTFTGYLPVDIVGSDVVIDGTTSYDGTHEVLAWVSHAAGVTILKIDTGWVADDATGVLYAADDITPSTITLTPRVFHGSVELDYGTDPDEFDVAWTIGGVAETEDANGAITLTPFDVDSSEVIQVTVTAYGNTTVAEETVNDLTDGSAILAQYSEDGSGTPDTDPSIWHTPYVDGDKYIIERLESGAWSSAKKIVGDNGEAGPRGFGVWIAFHDNAIDDEPTKPADGWEFKDGETGHNDWTTKPDNTNGANWMSFKVSDGLPLYDVDGNAISPEPSAAVQAAWANDSWSAPVRIQGSKGEDGTGFSIAQLDLAEASFPDDVVAIAYWPGSTPVTDTSGTVYFPDIGVLSGWEIASINYTGTVSYSVTADDPGDSAQAAVSCGGYGRQWTGNSKGTHTAGFSITLANGPYVWNTARRSVSVSAYASAFPGACSARISLIACQATLTLKST